ncbi:hypothetical protein Fmac_021287 [Flemingia macrophylla]|uniref:Uncharacterized protein n=1 Tax=Flemingia macrophylla TaxID=520843 RepID=A0ABD1LY54_9FABA
MSFLTQFSAPENQLNGSLPPNTFHILYNIQLFEIGENRISGPISSSITNASNFLTLDIGGNHFMGQVPGQLPNSLGNLSAELSMLFLAGNRIFENILAELGNLIDLIGLGMENNLFEGIIPTTFRKFQNMQVPDLSGNRISGDIPDFIGNLS